MPCPQGFRSCRHSHESLHSIQPAIKPITKSGTCPHDVMNLSSFQSWQSQGMRWLQAKFELMDSWLRSRSQTIWEASAQQRIKGVWACIPCFSNIDGRCFGDVADRDGNVLDNPPLAEDIAYESELRDCKLIAWAADDSLLPRQGQRGFPHWAIWQERNKRFTHHFSQFFKDHRPADIASSIATRCPALHCWNNVLHPHPRVAQGPYAPYKRLIGPPDIRLQPDLPQLCSHSRNKPSHAGVRFWDNRRLFKR